MSNNQKDRTYNYILSHYEKFGINGEEKLRSRFLLLFNDAEEWIRSRDLNDFVGVSEKVIEDILIDYFSDIIRLKEFHDIELVNDIKVASYTAFWVNKRKPLFYKKEPLREDIENNPFLNHINEWFSLMLLLAMVYDQTNQQEPGYKEREKFNAFLETLHYNLTYRIITPQFLELSLLALESSSTSPRLNDGGTGD